MSAEPATPPGAEGAPTFLRDLWYMAGLAGTLKRGGLRREMLLGEPVLLGRMRDGTAFALRDICPHRGVPLSAGKVMPENTVECPYHGWRFRADGVCALIPSTVDGQDTIDPSKIRVRNYPVREQDGLIWIYMASAGQESVPPKSEPPRVGVPNATPRWVESQTFACNIDHAVIGLMDPAHAPYVHGRWWWKKTPRVKEKHYAPLPNGFVMTRHKPTKAAYSILGGSEVSTEITFELPATRFENIRGTILGKVIDVVGLTTCTPIDGETTQVTQVFFWPLWLGFIKPFFMLLGPVFLGDDRRMVELQRQGLIFNPPLLLIQDSDVPAMWYHRLKKAWAESVATGVPFVNPVKERTLKWRS
ncbi:MAG TPA: aromatic ring-hydroxylating dioxygenase subunit alpha [Rhizomicrobium sp.]|jgi:phenylpropionate dioxygenase-like ring-hydroxylating dioxygenase large terminal subunit|nr:aromatic ring-hydroxylating dioxygenase subunit alpha [Rhizomicrobium sp.]